MEIDIWSDVICPWCYLGSRRLATALERFDGGDDVTVRWHAFELDPGAPPEVGDLRSALERKYGPGSFDAMTGRLTALGEADGIEYRFEDAKRVNTFDAHRVISSVVHDPAAQGALVQRLFRAYFTEGADLSDRSELVRLAVEAGLEADAVAELLASGGRSDEVRADEAEARQLDITGVPAFVIDRRVMIPGAQDADTIVRILERVTAAAS
jgi:predicted DsbA family dithiol-disulfide isomerase